MTITSLDQLINGLTGYPVDLQKDAQSNEAAGIWHSAWAMTGTPGVGATPSGGLNGTALTGPAAGALPIPAPVTGEQIYLARAEVTATAGVGTWCVDDWLWSNGSIAIATTTQQAITTPTWPSRDATGSTVGLGVYAALYVSSATGNAGAITNTTLNYTNHSGVSGRTATIASFPATGVAGTFVPFSLQAGDSGIRSIQGLTLGTSYVSGTVHLIAFRLVARIPTPNPNIGNDRDFAALGLPKVWDNSVLAMRVLPTGTSVGAFSGSLAFAQA